jgi:hypothetical protein
MSKLSIINLFLFVIVVSLASLIYFSEEQSTQLDRLTDININHISSIKIQHNKNTTRINKQTDNQWQITQPVNIAANNFRINSILKLINAPVHSQYSIDEIDLEKTGLHDPSTIVQFNKQIIAYGITNPATNLRYIRLNNTVYTIEDAYYPLITSHFGTLVSLYLLPANSQINKLVLINQTISKNDKGLWQSSIDISADNINKTIDHWQQGQAFGVHQYLKRDELGEILIYLDNQQQAISYLITDIDPWLIIARPDIGLEYHLDVEAYDDLIAPQ